MSRKLVAILPFLASLSLFTLAPAEPPSSADALSPPAKRNPATGRKRPTAYTPIEVKEGGVITGVVRYSGAVPPPRKIQIVKDHQTCGNAPSEEQPIKVGADGRVAEAIVFLADIRQGKPFEQNTPAPRINQKSCRFEPHVQAVRAGTPIEIINSDPVAHNIKADQRIYTLFNVLQPQQNMKSTQKFDKPGLVDLKCNVHDWMRGFVYVFLHPYYSVTTADGVFKLENVPPGKYELIVWQEHLGEQSYPVEVSPGRPTDLNIVLDSKP